MKCNAIGRELSSTVHAANTWIWVHVANGESLGLQNLNDHE